jgi:beta-fructofuranosidase
MNTAKPSQDLGRPRYHFLPPANWMNDPNGCIQWQGSYHLFYQHNPHGAFWGTMHWGHAVSQDLVHWTHLPIALAPTPGGPDQGGCFSGCAVDNHGTPTLVYTGVDPQVQCIATSDDGLLTWQKHPSNPVLANPPTGVIAKDFRDPYVWREGQTWYMALGSGIENVGGVVLLYRSEDLLHWTYVQPLCTGHKDETGTIWECPNFFPLGGKHVLIISPIPLRRSIYFVGTYANHTFTPETRGELDLGGHYYAPQSFVDERGRRLMWGWLWEGRSGEAQRTAGWAGVMSLPRVLSLRPDGQLGMVPAPEVEVLRGKHQHHANMALPLAPRQATETMQGEALEIRAVFAPGAGAPYGLHLRRAPEGVEQTSVVYDPQTRTLAIDRNRASLDPATQHDTRSCPLELGPVEPLTLRIFLDHSVVEVFANERACLTSRIYPTRADSLGVLPFATQRAELSSLDIWEMRSIWDSAR